MRVCVRSCVALSLAGERRPMRRPGEARVATQIDLRILELVCSRLCHDLVGPVGAVNNGIELLEEFDPSMADDVLPLLRNSARQAWRRLDCFRLAFGAAGGRDAWPLGELGSTEERRVGKGGVKRVR